MTISDCRFCHWQHVARRRSSGFLGASIGNRQSTIDNGPGARVIRVNPDSPDSAAVAEAVEALKAGALVAFPTDTLYALAADPFRAGALERVFAAKGRDAAKVVSVLVTDVAMAAALTRAIPTFARALMDQFWPGPLTLILPPAPGLPSALVPQGGGIGVRAPQSSVAQAVLRRLGGPVVGTSANRAGGPHPSDAAMVLREVGAHLALLLDGGPTPVGAPSTVMDCTAEPPRILRAGAISLEAVRAILPLVSLHEDHPEPRKW